MGYEDTELKPRWCPFCQTLQSPFFRPEVLLQTGEKGFECRNCGAGIPYGRRKA